MVHDINRIWVTALTMLTAGVLAAVRAAMPTRRVIPPRLISAMKTGGAGETEATKPRP